jgi:hypothetical protein
MKQRLCVCRSPNLQTLGTFRFSQPLGALFRPMPAGHISCQIRSWGSSSSELFSLHVGANCSQLPVPHVVARVTKLCRKASLKTTRCKHRITSQALHMTKPGETPSTSGYCSTRRSDTLLRRFRPKQSRCSPEAFAPPGCSPSPAMPGPSSRAPLMQLPCLTPKRPAKAHYRGLLAGEMGLSLARLPTLLGFVAL